MMASKGIVIASLTLMAISVAHALYPDDHWNYSTRLTQDNFMSTLKDVIESDKTLFVRWIASAE